MWQSLNCLGPIARTAGDARVVVSAMAGLDQQDRYSGLASADIDRGECSTIRLVASEDLGTVPVEPVVRRVFHEAVNRLESAGIDVHWDDPGLPASGEIWMAIAASESYCTEHSLLESNPGAASTEARQFLELGRRIALQDYLRAHLARDTISAAYVEMLGRHNAMAFITPTMGTEAPALGAAPLDAGPTISTDSLMDESDGLVIDASLAGLPACAIPIGLSPTPLPVSMQIIGLRGHDHQVLAVAQACELAIAWNGAGHGAGSRTHPFG
jgi:Asp-tRNA(Asn)/Glu-tRNA(Gln) amidotransferase A subunit family amidase